MKIGKYTIRFQSPVLIEKEPNYEKDVIEHLRNGLRLHAIKVYMEATGASLYEAKEAIETKYIQHYVPPVDFEY